MRSCVIKFNYFGQAVISCKKTLLSECILGGNWCSKYAAVRSLRSKAWLVSSGFIMVHYLCYKVRFSRESSVVINVGLF